MIKADLSKDDADMQEPRPSLWRIVLAGAALVYLVLAVFWPIPGFEFVDLDVNQQILDNPHIRGLTGGNLKRMFTARSVTSYYPIRSLSLAIDYHFWGLNPTGFKLTNGLIHVANVLLVFWLILRLFHHPAPACTSPNNRRDVCVAAFCAGIFAVHPVVVEPVTWVPGREELLMVLGTVGCIHFYLTGRRLAEKGAKPRQAITCYMCAALCCAVACLSNAVAAVIPVLVVAWDVLTCSGPRLRRILWGTSALWVIGTATIVIKKLGSGSEDLLEEMGAFSAQRLMLVLKVYWLNLTTIFWPTNLAVDYPDVTAGGVSDEGVILGLIAVGLTCLILWSLRRRKVILYGLVWCGLALGPASQIMPHGVHRADRFLYLPLVGMVVALASGLRLLVRPLKGRSQVAGLVAAGVLGLLALNMLSAGQIQTWRNSISMWERCLEVDANNALAHGGLADNLAKTGQYDRAIRHYWLALRLDSYDTQTLKNFAVLLGTCREKDLRDYEMAIALAKRACELAKRPDPAAVMVLAEVYAQAGRSEMVIGTTEEAIGMAEAAGDLELADELRRRLKQYQDDLGILPPIKPAT